MPWIYFDVPNFPFISIFTLTSVPVLRTMPIDRIFYLCLVSLLGACTTLPPVTTQAPMAYIATASNVDRVFAQYAPVFVHENDGQLYNRIGFAKAYRDHNDDIKIAIDPGAPKIYVQQTEFEGELGR
ncbi:hypothetical protein ACFL17_10730 [Pseudomonadota bacterium]